MNDFLKTAQWKSGARVADFLDGFFQRRGWRIEPTTPYQERALYLGDRIFTRGKDRYYVEYKSGIQSHFTGNIFLETVSVDTRDKAGWVFTCTADVIFYAALLDNKILVFIPNDIRRAVPDLRSKFREVSTKNKQNKGYNTHGLIVPMPYAEQHLAAKVIALEMTP